MKGARNIPTHRASGPAPDPKLGKLDLTDTLDFLMSRWCRRGALRPIQLLLRAYPGPLWHAYHKLEMIETLERLNGLSREDLPDEERRIVTSALDLLKGGLPGNASGQTESEQAAKPL
jgi:hypothetical protein